MKSVLQSFNYKGPSSAQGTDHSKALLSNLCLGITLVWKGHTLIEKIKSNKFINGTKKPVSQSISYKRIQLFSSSYCLIVYVLDLHL